MRAFGSEQAAPAVTEALLGIASLGWREAPRFSLEGPDNWGRFEGDLNVRMLNDGRLCELLADYVYVRQDGSRWMSPKGTRVDGASIPPIFWSLIGGPFEGKYRNASVIHDHYCDTEERSWRDTHRMFYEAMRCNGVAAAQAKIMYYAVYRFGPRWHEPGGLVPEGATRTSARPPSEATATTLLADAEAIYAHDLSIEAIENLADAREDQELVSEGTLKPQGAGSDGARLANTLVICGGRGTAEDLDAVAREAALLPDYVLKRFERKRVRIVACRDSVTDFETDLRGKIPRGWEATGRTWDSVPGTFFNDRRRVVIATIAEGGRRVVPRKTSGKHGSDSLVVHESLHGFDYLGGHEVLREPRFVSAREADFAQLGSALGGYLVQPGRAGLEETFAESGARHVVDAEGIASEWPNLATYWKMGPADMESLGSPFTFETPAANSIGTAKVRPDGSIQLDLRAEGPGGAIGHAVMEVPVGDPAHRQLREHVLKTPIPEGTVGEFEVPFMVD
jgi:hypothetical protein